jgi:hypothetical protein
MSYTTFLIQNLSELSAFSHVMDGGKMNNSTTTIGLGSGKKSQMILYSILFFFIGILLKGLIVYLVYNTMMPKLIYSFSENKTLETIESNFKQLTYVESILLVILTNTLFYF